jgi:hypothetical protein
MVINVCITQITDMFSISNSNNGGSLGGGGGGFDGGYLK